MIEIWTNVKGNSNYEVSSLGRIRNKKGNLLRPEETKKGYLRVNLTNNGKTKHYKVHRLVALAFIPNKNNLPQINHKDENKKNNRVGNLEWCDNWYNSHYGSKSKIHEGQVKLFDYIGE